MRTLPTDAAHRNARIPKFEAPSSQISDVPARRYIFYPLLFFYSFFLFFFSTEFARAARNSSSAPRVNAFQAKIDQLFEVRQKFAKIVLMGCVVVCSLITTPPIQRQYPTCGVDVVNFRSSIIRSNYINLRIKTLQVKTHGDSIKPSIVEILIIKMEKSKFSKVTLRHKKTRALSSNSRA